ncbi:MAG: hypothetical protein ACK5LN_07475 [Propioniciclava sp.]
MIIWRGWGVLSILLLAVGFGLSAGIASAAGVDPEWLPWISGIGGLAAIVGNWFLGTWLNVTRPDQKAQSYRQERGAFLQQAVDNGQFHLGPGHSAPTSQQEAQQQADWLLQQETAKLMGLRNMHTLFFVPMQYISFLAVVPVIAIVGVSLFG